MVTARADDVDKIRGLGFGADDYIEKPFSPSVLVARVKANLSQYRRLKLQPAKSAIVEAGPLRIDTEAHTAAVRGEQLTLTNKEYELLLFLARHPNQFSAARISKSSSGSWNPWATISRSRCMSTVCVKRWRRIPPSRSSSRPSGASAIV